MSLAIADQQTDQTKGSNTGAKFTYTDRSGFHLPKISDRCLYSQVNI
ncbi:hypothetical protein LOK49_LG15G02135 [Camellia lanceoleosa]|uniref:Uncharacterized protein n=1 Tax=Camellia lanceoleosa TaxID=1840588 RepID=A0ACC0F1J3_9ERIC|nr:hypothetical protein LOK49_LG15G02135 [Camellia lanceoleosa]